MNTAQKEAYLKQKNEELEAHWQLKARRELEKELMLYYQEALQEIQKDIDGIYARFAEEEGVDVAAIQARLSNLDATLCKKSIEEYLRTARGHTNSEMLQELNTLHMRYQLSRLDKLYADTCIELSKLAEKFEKDLGDFMGNAYKDCYYHNLFEIGRTHGLVSTPVCVDTEKLLKFLDNPWSGKHYSDRIWANQDKLARVIKQQVLTGMHRGVNVEDLSRAVTQQMGVGMDEARRLVRTELNYAHNKGALDSITDAGMKYYRFIATLDKRTSHQCREHDGKIYPVEDGSPGTNMPPLHPHCRSTIAGSLKKDNAPKGKRIARKDNGRTYRVPAELTYSDWQTIYIDKRVTYDQWKQAKENFAHHDLKNGIIKVDKVKLKEEPYAVTKREAKKQGGSDWNFYDAKGNQYLQVSDNAHGHKEESQYGEHGEHAHWLDLYKKPPEPHGKAAEVPSFVRTKMGDVL